MRRLTRIPSSPDPRDREYPLRLIRKVSAPKPRTFPYKEQAVLDQGDTPHCVGFSCEGFLRAAPLMTKAPTPAGEIYTLAQKLDEWDGEAYEGTSVRAGAQALQAIGHVKNYLWVDVREPSKAVQELAAFILDGYGTTIVGTGWYASMDEVDANGVMRAPSRLASPLGGHAWRVVWYDKQRMLFKMVNSWGPTWGIKGAAWLTPELLARLLREDGEACAPVQVTVK